MCSVPEEKKDLLSSQLNRPDGVLSAGSTPRSTPRATPDRCFSPLGSPYYPSGANSCLRRVKFMAPKFYAAPHSRVVEEGESVQFQCAIAGVPTPWSTWDKDGHIVSQTTRLTLKERGDLRVLEIQEVTFEDAGLYRITLENDYGRIEATARLDVIGNGRHPPQRDIRTSASPRKSVSRRIMGNSTKIGGRLALATNFRGGSVPSNKFYHNGDEIQIDNERVRIIEEATKITLIIENATKADEGIYTCLAEDEDFLTASSTNVTLSKHPERIAEQKPEFIYELEAFEGVEGDQFIDLQCVVCSESPFDVEWMRDGKILENANNFWYLDHGRGLIGLRIMNPTVTDSGKYTCKVITNCGSCTTSNSVKISRSRIGKNDDGSVLILAKPEDVLATSDSAVSFACQVSDADVNVKWFICGREVTRNDRGILVC